jgi:prepilin-type N-terminal cleavage/methylation domain-containing protein
MLNNKLLEKLPKKLLQNQVDQKFKAFTLLELAIVMVLIGLIIAGVTKGGHVVTASRLASARSITAKSNVANIKGLIAWYETSSKNSLRNSQITNLANVSDWFDVSPGSIINQRNRLTKTASANLIYDADAINRIPSLEFKNNDRISIANFYQGPINRATICAVFRPYFNPSTATAIIVDSAPGQASFYMAIKNNALNLNAGVDGNTLTTSNPASFINGKDYVVCGYFNSSSSSAYVNNAITMAGGSNINSGTNSLNGLTIGASNTGTAGFTGLISEIIIYNRPLKLQERKDVMLYLGKKYQVNIIN